MAKTEPYFVSIDIGSSKVGVLIGQRDDKGGIEVVGKGLAPNRGTRKGNIVNVEATVEALKAASEEAEVMAGVEISRAYGGRSDVGFTRLVELMLLQSPSIMLLLLPFICLFGTMAAFVTLNRRSELIAMRAAGGLRDDRVHHAQLEACIGRRAKRTRCPLRLAGVLPEDRCAALG